MRNCPVDLEVRAPAPGHTQHNVLARFHVSLKEQEFTAWRGANIRTHIHEFNVAGVCIIANYTEK
jgi:hypothetical protein